MIKSELKTAQTEMSPDQNGPDRMGSERIGQTETARSNRPDRKAAYPSIYSLLFLTMQDVMNVQMILILLLKSFENEKDFWVWHSEAFF